MTNTHGSIFRGFPGSSPKKNPSVLQKPKTRPKYNQNKRKSPKIQKLLKIFFLLHSNNTSHVNFKKLWKYSIAENNPEFYILTTKALRVYSYKHTKATWSTSNLSVVEFSMEHSIVTVSPL